MNKKLSRSILVLIALLLILSIVFWGRLSGSYTLFQMTGEFTRSCITGKDNLNLKVTGSWGQNGRLDSLRATVHYKKDHHFLADVQVKHNQYVVQSDQKQTLVLISNPKLIITGNGPEQKNFDILLLLGEIVGSHPQLAQMLDLNWTKRLGISVWSFMKCDFTKKEWQGKRYQIIRFPHEINENNPTIWKNLDQPGGFRIVAGDSLNPFSVTFSPVDSAYLPAKIDESGAEKLLVNRRELNTAIYRGAVRAATISIENRMPPKPDGKDRVWGKGLLTYVNGNRVLIAKGTHREIGRAHGALLKQEVRQMADATLYTICWVYTLERRHWFLDDMRGAYARLAPFIPEKYEEEMAGLAETSGISLDEIHLTNVFPALFHCSGFALFNKATVDGKLYHGRVLDYITDLGLQYNAVVYILQPKGSFAFANVGFAGFIGSVSGMNDQQVAFGEMGGAGEGDWDGMPMAFLMREGLERAKTLAEAVTIFRDTPRTCQYFYVISDGKIPDARGLATTPAKFEVVKPNQLHPLLQHPVEDAVLMSAGDRYEKLFERVKQNYGKIDAEKAIRLMDRPVAMKSNLHDVLFAPQSLEFWVANAGAYTPASSEPYTHYSLPELLQRLK